MAGVRFVITLCLLCCEFHLLVNQVIAAKVVKPLNYPLKEQNSSMKQSDFASSKLFQELFPDSSNRVRHRRNKEVCSDNEPMGEIGGFPLISRKDLRVKFLKNGKHLVNVSWETPQGKNGSSLDGYWFTWAVRRDNGKPNSEVCNVLSAEKTSFVIYESLMWNKYENIYFWIKPLPSIFQGKYFKNVKPFRPVYDVRTTRSTSTSTTAASTTATSTTATTNSTNKDITSQSSRQTDIPTRSINVRSISTRSINVRSGKKQTKGKEKETISVAILITISAVLSVIGFIVASRYRKKKHQAKLPKFPIDPGYIYVSYISESKGETEKVIDFVSWFREQGYNVQMDIMLTSDKQDDLRELGRHRWGQEQLSKAKNVFIILSPSFLNLCRRDEGKTDTTPLTENETIVYNEITRIRDELSSTAHINSRFIPVLFGVKETGLPFWIKERVVYSWPEDKINYKLLYRINDEVASEDTNEDSTATSKVWSEA